MICQVRRSDDLLSAAEIKEPIQEEIEKEN